MARRLSAILAADVVGYSRLMEKDEAGTLAALKARRAEVVDLLIAENGGRIVKLMGDGMLVEFPSVVAAVACAVAMQIGMAERNAAAPADTRIEFRIGVNLGDVIVEGDDIFGDGVNVAARLEALAEPGGICISGTVHESIVGKFDHVFIDSGDQTVKNIARPIRVWRWAGTTGDTRPAHGGPAATAAADRSSIAVLPFANMSGDPEQEYFSDGLAEDIITALSHWHGFPVVARNSSFSYKGQNVRVQDIASDLGVRYVLEGSVRKAGRRLRITAQLIDAASGLHIWAERFDRELEDIFDIQDEITHRIAATIVPELEHFEHKHSVLKRTEDLNAWDYYLRGMATFYDETCDGMRASIEMFRAAVDLDERYCDAWARLGWCHAMLIALGCVDDKNDCLRQGFDAARRAIRIDDGSALAHMSLGSLHIQAEQTELGLAETELAFDLNPNFAHAAMALGNRLDLVGRTEDGIARMERALQLNPRDPARWRYMAYLSRAYVSKGDLKAAAEWARKSVSLRPDLPEALFRCAVVLAHLGEESEVRGLLDRCNALDPHYLARRTHWQPYADASRNEHLLGALRRYDAFRDQS